MKKIAGFAFKKNGKAINVHVVNEKIKGVPICDTLCLEFKMGRRKFNRIFMRPDEALLIASFLTGAVYNTTSAYKFGMAKKK